MAEPARHTYTHGHHDSVLRSHRWRTVDNSAAHLLPHLRSGLSLLDVGCGPGTLTVDLARRVAPGRVTAVEVSEDVLQLARDQAAEDEVDNVDFRVGDAQALDLSDASFDIVHSHQMLHHVADPVQALREMRRVCRPGGIVAVRDADFGAFTWFPAVPELDEWLSRFRDVMRANGGEPDAGRRLLSWARAAGFTDVTASASTWCFSSDEDKRWWAESWAERVRQSDLAGHLAAAGTATPQDLDRIAAGWTNWAQSPDAWFIAVHGELVCRA